MFPDLILSYPWWTVIPVVLTGLVYAALLYYRNRLNKLSPVWTAVLFVFRFLAVSLLVFLLLSPFLRTQHKVVEKPVLIFAFDNSRSMAMGKDSAFDYPSFLKKADAMADELSDSYEPEFWIFDKDTKAAKQPDFSGETSDYARMLSQLNENYNGVKVGALVIFGDGIFNRGIDPLHAASPIGFPIYTIALGDTGLSRDLKIADLRYNQLVYLDDDFPLEVSISATDLKGEKAVLRVYAFGKQVVSKQFLIGSLHFSKTFRFTLKAAKPGKQHIRISLETEAGELNKENNRRSTFIDVLNNRQKILILADAPHPDLGALKESIEKKKNYLAEIQYAGKLKGKLTDYDLVILHQLPSKTHPVKTLLSTLEEKEIPVLYILGRTSGSAGFNQHFKGFNIQSAVGNFEEARMDINPSFSLFTFPSELARQLENLPPLQVPLGNYSSTAGTSVFAYQEIKNISTDFPLVAFNINTGQRAGVITGEGLWLWRMHNYREDGNTAAFDAFVDKTVQLLMARKDKRHFRVITKGNYSSYKNVVLRAELYNQAYETVNDVDVSLQLTNEDGEQFNYVFSPYGQNYRLNLNYLPEGIYRYRAQTALGSNPYSAKGEFVVSSHSLEGRALQANHRMLFRLAAGHDGKMLQAGQLQSLPRLLRQRDDQAARIYYEEQLSALHKLPLVLLLILALLSLEWLLRKYFGSY